MVQMIERRRLPDIGEAHAYEVDLTDGETIRIVVSKAARVTGSEEAAFNRQLAATLLGRNTSVPSNSPKSFV